MKSELLRVRKTNQFLRAILLLLAFLPVMHSNAQTIISPTGDGGFETNTTFATNGWTAVLDANSRWYVGTFVKSAGLRGAYIDVNATAGAANNYNSGAVRVSHFYRDVTFPGGATNIVLSFKWKAQGESGTGADDYDYLRVFVVPTSTTPVAATLLPAANIVGTSKYQLQGTVFQTANITLSNAFAGTTQRLVFTWRNDGLVTNNPGAAVDEISLTYTPGTGCTGTPVGGATQSSTATACAGTPFTLSLSGSSSATGITYQWESSPNNSSWSPIAGATNASHSATQSAATWYRCALTCTTSTLSANSSSLQVGMSALIDCYCVGTYSDDCTIDYISNVTFGNINNTTTCSGSLPTNRTVYSAPNFVFYRGVSYPISITTDGDVEAMRAWIDYDRNFAIANLESIISAAAGGPPQTTTGSITIPLTAALGQTVLRVRCRYNTAIGAGGACNNFTSDFGETEDYIITIADQQLCTGTPAPGNTVSSTSQACASVNFTLSTSNSLSDLGITYQWQSSPDNNTWTNIPAATNSTLVTSQSTATWYRTVVHCSGSGLNGNSTALQVNMGDACACGAYCATSQTDGTCGGGDEYISNVTFNTINKSSTCAESLPGGYSNYTSISTTIQQGLTYPITFTNGGPFTGDQGHVFIDWTGDGDFADANEDITLTGSGTNNAVTWTGSIAVPLSSITGTTRMRVRIYFTTFSGPCGASDYGEAEDYCINILPATPCAGAPAPSSTVASANPACYNTPFTLSLGTTYTNSGLTYQWQSAPDVSGSPGTFTDVNGATALTYTAIQTSINWYHCIVTCSNGGQSITSSNLRVTTQLCYCTPVYTTGCAADKISNFVLNTLSNNSGTTCSTSPAGYSVYGTTPSNLTTSLSPGTSYTATITVVTGNANGTGVAIWIDYNDNGVFDVSENNNNGATKFASNTTGTLVVNVPANALPGQHRMRVVSARNTNSIDVGACSPGNATGETEDYTVTISDPSVSSNAPVCEGDTLKLFSTPAGASSYSWTGPNGFNSSLQNPVIPAVTPLASGVYQCTIVIGSTTYTPTVSVVAHAGPEVAATSNAPFCSATMNLNLASNAPTSTTFAWTGPGNYSSAQANPSITNAPNTASGNYKVVVTDVNGCKDSSVAAVVIYALPNVGITVIGNPNLCTGQTTSDLQGTGALDYTWSTSETTSVITVAVAGTYSVLGIDNHNCQNNASQVITESTAPVVPLISPVGPVTLCSDANGVIAQTLTCTNYTMDLYWSSSEAGQSISINYSDVITVTYTDMNGCFSTSDPVVVDFDAVAPSLSCPADVISCSTTPALGTPVTSDNCSVASVTNDAPAVFPLGTTEVTWTVTDYSNNMSTCIQQVMVQSPSAAPSGASANAAYGQICLGSSVTLTVDGGSLGTGATWNWYEGSCAGGGVIGTGSSITIIPATAGTHTYFVRAEGVCGNSACASTTVNVINAPPAGTVSFTSGLPTGCVGAAPASLSVNAVSGAVFYRWTSAQAGVRFNGNPSPFETTTPTVNVTFVSLPASGSSGWSICAFAGNACGNTNTICSWVRATVSAPASISGSVIGCPGSSANPYSTPAIAGAVTYQWSSTGGIVINNNGAQNIQVSFPANFISGTLSVRGQTSCGYNGPVRSMTITASPSIPAIITGPSYPCPNASSSYSIAPVNGAVNYTWSTSVAGAVVTGTSTSCSILFPAVIPAGSTVSVMANSSCPTSGAVRSKGIATGIPNVPANVSGPAAGQCGQQGVSYSINPVALATSYNWSATCGTIVGPANLSAVSVDWPSSFVVCTLSVTATNSCGTSTPRILGVFGAPALPAVISGNAAPCAGTIESYSTSGSTGATGYAWVVPAGAAIIGPATGSSITVLWGSTGGNVTVRASNDCGNSPIRSLACTIACRVNQALGSQTGTMDIFPNPANAYATVRFDTKAGQHFTLALTNMIGEKVLMHNGITAGENMVELNLASLSKGVYIISVETGDQRFQQRLTIQ